MSFREHGITGCGKHFPGHGNTDLDSHDSLPTVAHGAERLVEVEMEPYRLLLRDARNPLELVMTAHVLYPRLDPKRPATLSPRILRGLLRRGLGFKGLIVTDDLDMGAIEKSYGPEEACLLAFRAGADVLMFCHTASHLPKCIDALANSLERGETSFRELQRSLHRIQRFRRNLLQRLPGESVRKSLFDRIGGPEHQHVADRVLSYTSTESQKPSPRVQG
jgi:beta-N-acetylhexosaminidase